MITTNMHTTKVCILGSSESGKSSFISRFTKGNYTSIYLPTLFCVNETIILRTNVGLTNFIVKEIPGNIKYQDNLDSSISSVDSYLIFFDVNSRESFEKAEIYIEYILNFFGTEVKNKNIILCGNKRDEPTQKTIVDFRRIIGYIDKYPNFSYFEFSVKNYCRDITKPFLNILEREYGTYIRISHL